MFIKYKRNIPGQHKILPFFHYWHSQEQLMLSLDRADDSAVVHRLSSLDYCGCKSFGRFLFFSASQMAASMKHDTLAGI